MDYEQLRKDMEAGTQGDWAADMDEAFHIRDDQGGRIAQMIFMAGKFGFGGKRRPEETSANARRIARVPQLERIALAAEELAEECRDLGGANVDAIAKALAAYRKATQ